MDVDDSKDKASLTADSDREGDEEARCHISTFGPISHPPLVVNPTDCNQPDLVFDTLNTKPDELPHDTIDKNSIPFIGPIMQEEISLKNENIESSTVANVDPPLSKDVSMSNVKPDFEGPDRPSDLELGGNRLDFIDHPIESIELSSPNIVSNEVELMAVDESFETKIASDNFTKFIEIAKVEKPFTSESNFLKGCKWYK